MHDSPSSEVPMRSSGRSAPPLAILGCGNMGRAIVVGGINAGIVDPAVTVVAEPDAGQRAKLAEALSRSQLPRVRTVATAAEAMAVLMQIEESAGPGQILLAIKPQMLPELAADFCAAPGVGASGRIVISILAGTPGAKVRGALSPSGAGFGGGRGEAGEGVRVVRAMPNLPAAIGRSTTAVCLSAGAAAGDEAFALRLFRGVGREVIPIAEELMDAFTAVAGSGPAYLFYVAEAMVEAGVRLGFDRGVALRAVRETLAGAATMLADATEEPAELRAAVTSRGGTTQAATAVLDGAGVQGKFVEAITAARDRGGELARL